MGTLASQGLNAGAGVMSGVILARTLGPALRGELATVLLWPTVVSLLAEMGLGFSFSYHVGTDRSRVSELWTGALAYSLVVGGALSAGAWTLGASSAGLFHADLRDLAIALAATPCLLAVSYFGYLLLGAGAVFEANCVRTMAACTYTLGVVALAVTDRTSVTAFASVFTLSQLVSAVTACWLARWRLGARWRLAFPKDVLVYGLRSQLASLSAQATLRLDQVLMSFLLSPSALGLYVIAVAISGLVGPLFAALAIVALPRILGARSRAAQGAELARHVRLGVALGVPVVVVGGVAMPWLIRLAFGAAFLDAVGPARVLLLAALFQGLNAILGNSLRSLGLPGKPAIAEGVGLVVTVGLLALFLKAYGIQAAAYTSLIAYVIVSAMQLFYAARATELPLRGILSPRVLRRPTS